MTVDVEKLRELSKAAHALELGKAAEHLVCADLIMNGYRAYLSDQGLPYDAVVDIDGRLLRIQVKATCFAKDTTSKSRKSIVAYNFHVRRRGRNSTSRLSDKDCDIIALVALDIRMVAYFPVFDVGETVALYQPGFAMTGRYNRRRKGTIDKFPFDVAFVRWQGGPEKSLLDFQNSYRDDGWIEFNGERKTLVQWGKERDLSVCVLENRLKNGWSIEATLLTAASPHNRNPETLVSFNGENLTLNAWAKKYGLSHSCLFARVKKGWSIEKALTTPSRFKVREAKRAALAV